MGHRLHDANVLDAVVEGKARQGQVTNAFAGRVRLPLRAARKIVQFSGCSAEPPDEMREILDRKGGAASDSMLLRFR